MQSIFSGGPIINNSLTPQHHDSELQNDTSRSSNVDEPTAISLDQSPAFSSDSQSDDTRSDDSSDNRFPPYPRKRQKYLHLSTPGHLESQYTIGQHRNLLKSIEIEFNSNLTSHLWSTVLIKRQQAARRKAREKQLCHKDQKRSRSRGRRATSEAAEDAESSASDTGVDDGEDEESRTAGRTMRKELVSNSWTAWPLPPGCLPPLPLHTTAPIYPPLVSPHPLEEAITALFLRQSAQALRERNPPVEASADDDVSAHTLQPIINGILAKLDRLLVAVHSHRERTAWRMTAKGLSRKQTARQLSKRMPLNWSAVLGLAGLSGWDRDRGSFGSKGDDGTGSVGRATQRISEIMEEKMEWRAWPEREEENAVDSSEIITYPIWNLADMSSIAGQQSTTPPRSSPAESAPFESAPADTSEDFYRYRRKIVGGVHNDGFLELLPTRAQRNGEQRRRERTSESEGQTSE